MLGEGALHAFKYRMHDTRVGRFWSVDPLAGKFPWNSVYAFAENMPIWARELEGLEAKIAIAGVGDIENTYYSKSDINAFEARALKLTKEGFDEIQVRNGVSLINTLKDATKKEGSILKIVSFAHSSENGIYLDYDEGFYSTLTFSPDKHYANVDMLVKEVSKGSVKFETDAVWIFASCNTARGYKNSLNPLALNVALKLNITTIGSTGPVYPEIVKGKETGRLKTDGTFKKFEPYEVSVSREIVKEHSFLFFRWTSTEKVTSTETKVKVTDLGNTIDPSEY